MLNTCVFLIDDFYHLQHSTDALFNECVFTCIIKDGSSFENYKIQEFHKLEFTENPGAISFYFDLQTNEVCNIFSQWLEKNEKMLFRYFFHPSYKTEANKPLLFINAAIKENKNLINGISYLNKSIIEQGYDGIHCIWLNEDINDNRKDLHLIFKADRSDKTFSAYYFQRLSENYCVSKYIAVYTTDFENQLIDFKKAEETLLLQHPEIHCLLQRNADLEKGVAVLTSELKDIKSQLQNQRTYLKLLTEQDEANKINEFYHQEYEILPLWYKKIGQLIKVCMGKRTFRSLFDNNVKKYKE
jgi:hypothetical protein